VSTEQAGVIGKNFTKFRGRHQSEGFRRKNSKNKTRPMGLLPQHPVVLAGSEFLATWFVVGDVSLAVSLKTSRPAGLISPSSTVQCWRAWFLRGEGAWVFTTFRFNC
jgi:hypothetical protein